MIMQARRAAPVLSNEYPSIAERRKLGLYVTHMEVELAERFGEHAARLFLENFGGGELFVPLKATDNHPVSKLVGRDVLEWLITKYGSGAVEVPHGAMSSKNAQAIRIRRLIVNTTLSTVEIAKLTRVSRRTARRTICTMREAGVALPNRPQNPKSKEKFEQ